MTRIAHAGLTDPGLRRLENEDAWRADARNGLFIVSDGMGAQFEGALAAKVVIEALPPLLAKRLPPSKLAALHVDPSDDARTEADPAADHARQVLCQTLCELSDTLRMQTVGEPGLEDMGATVVLAIVRQDWALVAHMGDSRAYLLRDGQLRCLTKDHSLVQVLLDAGEIKPDDVATHPTRGKLTRYVGMAGEALPDACLVALKEGDRLLLCTDGLTGMVRDADICRLLSDTSSPEHACTQLVEAAKSAGGEDNITVVVVDV